MSKTLAAALWYAENGWFVFPCRVAGKEPITPRGFHDATTDPAQIKAWWKQTPSANIGIATEASGLVVVDVDTKNDGEATYEALRAELGADVFDTVTALTPSGGQHLVYATDGTEVSSGAHVLGQGIDIRAAGGYIVVAPSVVGGNAYTWEVEYSPRDRKPAMWPDALAAKIVKRTVAAPLEEAGIIASGERNATMASIAGSLRRRGLDQDEILGALYVVNAKRCRPMLDNSDVDRIAQSICRYAPSEVIGYVEPDAEPMKAEHVYDVFMRMHNRYEEKGAAIPFGIQKLDKELGGMFPGKVTTVAARTGVGKSAIAEHIVEHAALHGKVLYFALELDALDTVERIAARHEKERVRLYREAGRPMSDTSWLKAMDLHIYDGVREDTEGVTVDEIVREVKRVKPNLVVIDHARELPEWTPSDKTRADLAPKKVLRALRSMAKAHRTHVLLVHQCTRDADGKRPTLADLSDSASVEQSSHNVVFIHRPFQFGDPDNFDEETGRDKFENPDNVAELLVWKSREAGSFIAHMAWDGQYMRFRDFDEQSLDGILTYKRCCKVKGKKFGQRPA